MGIGAVAEPLVVVVLLFGGTWINRMRSSAQPRRQPYHSGKRDDSQGSLESGNSTSTEETDILLGDSFEQNGWHRREVTILGYKKETWSPDTHIFQDRLLSRLLCKFPFLVEAWYWALIYWVYQLGRAVSAVTLVDGTVDTARRHALELIHLEQTLHVFVEPQFQRAFMAYPTLMHWINRIYSFIHIPGTILFLVWLYYHTISSNRSPQPPAPRGNSPDRLSGSPTSPALYQARRRTMAVCNLLAFIVFTAWPCMPPRLLSDPNYTGSNAEEARSFGFVDTVHGASGESSVWTQNKFCNQYAAMPSLHFGYSLLVGLTIATIPLTPKRSGFRGRRLLAILVGTAYPTLILVAIIATANHFILDAVAGAIVCALAWNANAILLNLLPLEDWFLWCMRLHKPEIGVYTDGFEDYGVVRRVAFVEK